MNEMIKSIKLIHKDSICVLKIESFYHCYGKDSYILAYLFGYNIKVGQSEYRECGFPSRSVNKIMAKLENLKINYLIIDRRNEYDVDTREDYKNLNNYEKCFNKAKTYLNYKERINNINRYLLKNMESKYFRKILGKIESAINE